MEPTRSIGQEHIKENIILYTKKLITAIRIEKKCGYDIAADDASYFLKQVIFLLTEKST